MSVVSLSSNRLFQKVMQTINGAFTVELGNFIADSQINYWIYGHSHRNIKAQIGDTLIVSNQLGYISHGEHLTNGFNPSAMIEV